jgi:50S ribosomal protein L16 3-hydroxylase
MQATYCFLAFLPIGFFLACGVKVVDAFVISDKLRFGIKPLAASLQTISGPWNATAFSATQCWGRRPLLMTKAFDTNYLPSWDDITELACNSDEDDSVTSRLIQHIPDTLDTYQVELGPFEPSVLAENLKQNDKMASTLVVNDVDRLIPPVSDWMDVHFDFLPRWRRDDAQVSLAPIGGGIGSHCDDYDVFLVQTSGSREWEIAMGDISVEDEFSNLVEASEVRILNITQSTNTVELQAGDCLYIPPRVVHCGTSTSNDCITLSVGCRAPSASDLLSRLAEKVSDSTSAAANERYTDFDLFTHNEKALSQSVKARMKKLVLRAIEEVMETDEIWDDMVGRLITQPNRPTVGYPVPLSEMEEEWKETLGLWSDADSTLEAITNGMGALYRAEGISFASSVTTTPLATIHRLFAQGRVFEIHDNSPSIALLLSRIANGPPLDQNAISELCIGESSRVTVFLKGLIEEGLLYGDEDEEESEESD